MAVSQHPTRNLVLAASAFAGSVVLAVAQSEPAPLDAPLPPPTDPMSPWWDLLWIVPACICLVVAVFWVARRLRGYEAERLKREEEAAYRFEKSMIQTFGRQAAAAPEDTEETVAERVATPVPAPAPSALAPHQEALHRLRESGLIADEEDLVPSPGAPPLTFIRLRNGRTAILFSAGTTLEDAAPHRRAADILILPQADGEPMVCRPLGDYLSDQLFGDSL